MSELSELYRQLSYWKQKRDDASQRVKKLKKRRDDVKNAKNALSSTANGNSRDVNSKLRGSRNNLETGVEIPEKEYLLDKIFSSEKEDKGLGDNNLSQSSEALQRELNKTEEKIQEAQNDQRYAENKVSELNRAILRAKLNMD